MSDLSIEERFGIQLDSSLINRFHPTGLCLLETILGMVYSNLHANESSSLLYDWLQELFRDPFATSLYNNIASISFSSRAELYTEIYREVVGYIADTSLYITPWDIISRISNPDGTSILTSLSLPSQQIPVQFAILGNVIPSVYDLTLDEFMGIIAAYPFVGDFSVIIYGITTMASTFRLRLEQYLNSIGSGVYVLTTTVQTDDGPLIYKFNNLTFLSGFITPFSWVNEDHHNSWISIVRWINGAYETVAF